MKSLDVARAFDFDWVVALSEVWSDLTWDVPQLHAKTRQEFIRKLENILEPSHKSSPLGWVLVGGGGAGKTHLLGRFRHEARARGVAFVLVDMTDVRDFWETVLQGFLDSLQQKYDGELFQHQCLVRNVIRRAGPNKPVAEVLEILAKRKTAHLAEDINNVLGALFKLDQKNSRKHQDVVRALICLNSDDFAISSLGMAWLQGIEIDAEDKAKLGFRTSTQKPIDIVEALSWFMSLGGPTVLAFDQLDAIVSQHNAAARIQLDPEQANASQLIIQEIGKGLGSIRDRTCHTLPVVSCLESTWSILKELVLQSHLERFESPKPLASMTDRTIAEGLIRNRLSLAFQRFGYSPPYPTWPFKPEAFDALQTNTPREILKLCEAQRKTWIAAGEVTEVSRLTVDEIKETEKKDGEGPADELAHVDRKFQLLCQQANIVDLLEEKSDDKKLAPILQSALQCLLHEASLPMDVRATVEREFTGGDKTKPLHVRLRLLFEKEQEREEHFCLRALQWKNARAYQSRLKSAMTQSGIDRSLKFRRLVIVRRNPTPGGAGTQNLVKKFEDAGGVCLNPSDEELRSLFAIHSLKSSGDPHLEEWLRSRRPLSKMKFIRQAIPHPLFDATVPTPTPKSDMPGMAVGVTPQASQPVSLPPTPTPSTPSPWPSIQEIPLGFASLGNGKLGKPVMMPIRMLEKHTLILAGAGSGKTVLVKRLVEEAALLGVPSIVIDCANDLAALDEAWPADNADRNAEDGEKTKAYLDIADVVVWTPGKESGNPLSLEPLPDLGSLCQDEDELESAIAMVGESLDPIVAPGSSTTAQNKRGILSASLRSFAKQGGGTFNDLVDYLADLPADAGLGVENEGKLARQMADALKVAREKNPLLRSTGTPIDPAVLLGVNGPSNKSRISVINFAGLPSLESQRIFLSQLAMTLFTWIKKNPNPGTRPIRGLLVIDEARDFVPSQKRSECKEALIRLAAQARKYHLGLIFATQNPKDIDNKIVSNCSTHFYGKLGAPASIAVVRELIAQKGGSSGEDVPKLIRGQFYAHNADVTHSGPAKVISPLCLSHHRSNPLDESEIIEKARKSLSRS